MKIISVLFGALNNDPFMDVRAKIYDAFRFNTVLMS